MKIGVALGGGGSRGMAHLGVLKFLEDEGISIGAMAGTSIGGLVGAVYLSDISLKEMVEKFSHVEQDKLYGQRKGDEPSLLGLAGGTKVLTELLGDLTFQDLRIPFAVTAVDIQKGQMVVINEGKLIDAVLATIAVPGILPARPWGDRLLVDGGVFDPVPVSVVRELDDKLPVLAVVLTQENSPTLSIPVPEIPGAAPVVDYISRLRISRALNVFVQSIDVASKMLAELRLEVEQPEILVRPDLAGVGLLDKVNVRDMMAIGEAATREQKQLIDEYGHKHKGLFRILFGNSK
jgi:NTE family protein